MTACACGCGVQAKPGKTWIYGHQNRGRQIAGGRANGQATEVCPSCRKVVHVLQDGTLGAHWTNARKGDRMRCPAGSRGWRSGPPPKGRRVVVTVDVVIPAGWTIGDYAAEAGRVLREHATDGFVVSLDVAEEREVAS